MITNGSHPLPRRILIGFAESLAAPECCFSLQKFGFDVVAFTRKGSRAALRWRRGVEVVEVCAPEMDVEKCRDEIRSLVESTGVSAVLPLDDASVWLCDQIAKRISVPIVGPTGSLAELALNKWTQVQEAIAAGIRTPPTEYYANIAELPQNPVFPLVLKPSRAVIVHNGRLSRPSGAICADQREFAQAISRWPIGVDALLQPYIIGNGRGLFGFVKSCGVPCSWSAHRRVRMMNPSGSGASACAPERVEPELIDGASRFMANVGWTGMFMFEFLRDENGQSWFMELNGRAWGSMALSRRQGLEYAAWCVAQKLELEISPVELDDIEEFHCRHLGREIVYLLAVLRRRKSAAINSWPSPWRAAFDVLTFRPSDRWYNWIPGSFILFLDDAFNTIVNQLFRRRGE